MKAKQPKGNSSSAPLSREEGFWPFDDWDPDNGGGKPDPTLGDGCGSSSIKNYPKSHARDFQYECPTGAEEV